MQKSSIITLIVIIVIVAAGVLVGIFAHKNGGGSRINYSEFAQCISEKEATFFGAWWCPHCIEQKRLFGRAERDLPYIECANPDRSMNEACTLAGIESFPTWEFPTDEVQTITFDQIAGLEDHVFEGRANQENVTALLIAEGYFAEAEEATEDLMMDETSMETEEEEVMEEREEETAPLNKVFATIHGEVLGVTITNVRSNGKIEVTSSERVGGAQELEFLAAKTGCELPPEHYAEEAETPVIETEGEASQAV